MTFTPSLPARTLFVAVLSLLASAGLCIIQAIADESQPSGPEAHASQGSLDGVFRPAIAWAQLRTVKVYGAAAGRVDGYATGMIISPEGHIATMHGVFLDARQVRVVMHDGTVHPATVLRRDRSKQIALLKIEAATEDYFELPSEDVGHVGDWVITLSNAFKVADGAEPLSVSVGNISLRTTIEARLSPRDIAYSGPLVLIDAITSNPGAGGGAVITPDHQVVGMIGRIIASSETNTRLNYAVPAAELRRLLADPPPEIEVAGGTSAPGATAVPGELGIRLFMLSGRRGPAYVDRIMPGSPAAGADIKADDLVILLAGQRIGSVADFEAAMENIQAGQQVDLVLKRGDALIQITLTAAERASR